MKSNQSPPKKAGKTNIISILTQKIQAYGNALVKPTDAASLATFRVLFGALMVWEVYRYHRYDRVFRYYIEPEFYFPYELFPFIAPLPGQGMYLVFFVMGLSALGICLGFFYRLSAIVFFLTYTYVFLIDKAQYNNHYYLISLLGFLLILVDAHRWASIDQLLRPKLREEVVPFWHLLIFRAQLFVVYFFGGVAKLNADWLRGEPMRDWLGKRADYPVVGDFFTSELGVYFFTYGGLFFDLFIGFLLLWKRTRLLAFAGVLFFNLTNKWLFSIGIFPYAMIAATILFVEADWPRRMLRRARLKPAHQVPPSRFMPYRAWAVGFVTIYLALQILLPLRHFLYPGNVSWTEEGHRFAWHMKLRSKRADIAVYIIDRQTNQTWQVDPRNNLNSRQLRKMSTRPDMIFYYVRRLKENLEAGGMKDPIIRVDAWASLNGRPYQQIVDPSVNLAGVSQSIVAVSPWILPLQVDLFAEGDYVIYEELESTLQDNDDN